MPDRRGARWALTRIEGRRLVRHPLFLLGYLLSTIILVVFDDGSPYQYWNLIGAALLFGALAPWILLVTFLATQRVRPGVFELAQPPLVVIAFGAMGIALGRWLPARGAAPPLVLIAAWAASLSALPWVVQRQLEHPSDALHSHGAWNLAFLTGLTVAASAAALSRDNRSPPIILLALTGLAAATAGLLLGAAYTGGR